MTLPVMGHKIRPETILLKWPMKGVQPSTISEGPS